MEIRNAGAFPYNNDSSSKGNCTMNFIAQRIDIPEEHIESIQKGQGGMIEYKVQKAGVYKDKNGKVFAISTKCPHLGCELHWNADELTWDCSCHASRFDYKGNWVESPATTCLNNV